MEPRPYLASDRNGCLVVFDSNALAGREAFESYLTAGDLPSFTVLEHEGSIVGCGGFSIEAAAAIMRHGMIRRDVQGMGLGRFLLMYRLRQISKCGVPVQFARVTVDPKWARFYEKQGFKSASDPSGGATVELFMKLTVCA